MRLIPIIVTASLILTVVAFVPAAAAPDCRLDGLVCTTQESEGEDCSKPRSRGHHTTGVAVSAADASVAATRDTQCAPTRDSHYVLETTGVEASAGGARVRGELLEFEDLYWGELAYRFRAVYLEAETPDGTTAGAWHEEADFDDPSWPDPPYCGTGAWANGESLADAYVCPGVAPLAMLP